MNKQPELIETSHNDTRRQLCLNKTPKLDYFYCLCESNSSENYEKCFRGCTYNCSRIPEDSECKEEEGLSQLMSGIQRNDDVDSVGALTTTSDITERGHIVSERNTKTSWKGSSDDVLSMFEVFGRDQKTAAGDAWLSGLPDEDILKDDDRELHVPRAPSSSIGLSGDLIAVDQKPVSSCRTGSEYPSRNHSSRNRLLARDLTSRSIIVSNINL